MIPHPTPETSEIEGLAFISTKLQGNLFIHWSVQFLRLRHNYRCYIVVGWIKILLITVDCHNLNLYRKALSWLLLTLGYGTRIKEFVIQNLISKLAFLAWEQSSFIGSSDWKGWVCLSCTKLGILCYPPTSKASREVANLTWRKNRHTLVYGVKEFVCLSVYDEFWPQL